MPHIINDFIEEELEDVFERETDHAGM